MALYLVEERKITKIGTESKGFRWQISTNGKMVGISHDHQFGHYLILGFGGTMVELIKDRQIVMLPASREHILNALMKLKTWKLLDGFRGRDKADLDGIVEAVLAITALVEKHTDELVELEINPLMVLSNGNGVRVADALVRKRNT